MTGHIINKTVCLFFLLIAGLPATAQETFENDTAMARKFLRERGEVYFSFEVPSPELRRLSLIVSVDNYVEGRAYAYANKEEFGAFLEESIEFTVYTPPGEWYRDYRTEKEVDFHVKGEWDYYPTYTDYVDLMQAWADDYPDICEYIDAGTSVEGRNILFLKITGNKESHDPKPRFMYSSTMHGDETVGFVLMLRLIEYLLENYPENRQVELLLDNLEIWINPLANPDGAYFGGDGDSIVSPKRSNANNIDLNRNFPVQNNPDYTFDGRQPETVIMMELMEAKQFSLSANLHGGAEVMNYPWDYWERRHADDGWFEYICREYADTAMLYSPPGYMTFLGGVTNGWDWYSISGGRQDYVTYFTGGREVTMEISDIKHPPADMLADYWEYNRRSLLHYMEQGMFGIRGIVRDADTGEALKAKVTLLSHDRDSSHIWSDHSTDWYFRMTEGNTYDIMFSAEGYYSHLAENVLVRNRDTTRLDIQLNPLSTNLELPAGPDDMILNIFPSPARDLINIRIDLPVSSHIRIVLYDQAGRKVKMLYDGWAGEGNVDLSFDTGNIPPGIYILALRYERSINTRKFVITR